MRKFTPILPLVFSFIFLSSLPSIGQTVSNVNARLNGDNVIISYDLVGAKQGQKFRIVIFSSVDNFASPLDLVNGDVGEDQLGGSGKQIIWRAKEQLSVFSGNVTFEIRSTITFNPIQITSPNASSSFKADKSLPISWLGGMPNSTIQVELMKGNTTYRNIGSTANTNLFNYTIPKDVSKGSDFQIKLYDVSNRSGTEVTSSMFTIKGKGGPAKFLIPLLAVGAGVGLYMAGVFDNGNGNGNGDEPKILPEAPNPPDNVGSRAGFNKYRRALIVIPFSF